jgi:endonuclease III
MAIKLVPAEDVYETKEIEEDENGLKKRFDYVINFFQKSNPNPTTELKYNNPYELLVATILSAQSTDKRVNMVTPELFKEYPTPEKLAKATSEEVYAIISSVTYPGNKSEYLVNMAKTLVEKYKSKIPEDVEELQTLSGVGRKTAHIIASTVYGKPVLAVDTHVFRVAERIGLTTGAKTALESEEQLIKYLPKEVIPKFNYWLVLHGRYICTAKYPKCPECGVREICRYYNSNL